MSGQRLTLDTTSRDLAHSIAGTLQDLVEPPPEALTLFEQAVPGSDRVDWRIEAYYADPPDIARLGRMLADILGRPIPPFAVSAVPDLNWVALSQAALPPVHAGRFTIHGSHDRGRVARGPGAILIDAGEAFGTAHHATTYGCLLALDRQARLAPSRNALDLGCGSGVLAIALARALPMVRLVATDVDRQSVAVARANMTVNGVSGRIATVVASGLAAPGIRRRMPFDLVVANILADPLIALAGDIARAVAPKGRIVLSGLLVAQAPAVVATYRAHGFALRSHARIAGWSTLTLVKRC